MENTLCILKEKNKGENMKGERELREEAPLLDMGVISAIYEHMAREGYWDIIRKLRSVHPDIDKALDALVEHSLLEGRTRGIISACQGKYPYMPSELAKSCYERVFGRSLEERAREIHAIGLEKP